MPKGIMMRKIEYKTDRIRSAFHGRKVLTLTDLKEILGTSARITVFRKLISLDYRASYSHAGKYYTLNEIADYDEQGLWIFQHICFSKHTTLVKTLEHLVSLSPEGYFASELERLVHVHVHNALAGLCSSGRLDRQQIGGEYLYLSKVIGEQQLANRETSIRQAVCAGPPGKVDAFVAEDIQRSLQSLLSVLDEKQRRLYLGFESMKLGRGGDTWIAAISGVNVKTIARGRRELETGKMTSGRIRQSGSGRPPIKKNRSDPIALQHHGICDGGQSDER